MQKIYRAIFAVSIEFTLEIDDQPRLNAEIIYYAVNV